MAVPAFGEAGLFYMECDTVFSPIGAHGNGFSSVDHDVDCRGHLPRPEVTTQFVLLGESRVHVWVVDPCAWSGARGAPSAAAVAGVATGTALVTVFAGHGGSSVVDGGWRRFFIRGSGRSLPGA